MGCFVWVVGDAAAFEAKHNVGERDAEVGQRSKGLPASSVESPKTWGALEETRSDGGGGGVAEMGSKPKVGQHVGHAVRKHRVVHKPIQPRRRRRDREQVVGRKEVQDCDHQLSRQLHQRQARPRRTKGGEGKRIGGGDGGTERAEAAGGETVAETDHSRHDNLISLPSLLPFRLSLVPVVRCVLVVSGEGTHTSSERVEGA